MCGCHNQSYYQKALQIGSESVADNNSVNKAVTFSFAITLVTDMDISISFPQNLAPPSDINLASCSIGLGITPSKRNETHLDGFSIRSKSVAFL